MRRPGRYMPGADWRTTGGHRRTTKRDTLS
jgi:hypothetical protein